MNEQINTISKVTPQNDAWESYLDIEQHGQLTLSNIEFTTTNLCNMRCSHCAVGHTLSHKDAKGLPIELLLQRLEEIPHLRSMSITGGEPPVPKPITNSSCSPYSSSPVGTTISSNPLLICIVTSPCLLILIFVNNDSINCF